MTDFDELIGNEPTGAERERLRRTHELLLAAGPPPELSPELEAGPTLAMTLGGPARRRRPRLALLAAAAIAVAAVFFAGYAVGNGHNGGTNAIRAIRLSGTSLAPNGLATLQLQPEDEAGNWPMRLVASGLPALPQDGYYAVYLVRHGKPWRPCGWFSIDSPNKTVSISLNEPYRLEKGDSWIVTRQSEGSTGAGPAVLQPVNA